MNDSYIAQLQAELLAERESADRNAALIGTPDEIVAALDL